MILKLSMKHQGEELYKLYINHDTGMTLTYFTARSTWFTYAFEWGKVGKMSFNCRKLAGNEQMDRIFMLLKKNGPRGLFAPASGLKYLYIYNCNIQTSSLKLLGLAKPTLIWKILRKGEPMYT